MLAVVDTGPLYAVADADDDDHARCLGILQRREIELVIPAMVVAEATYLIGSRLGAEAEAVFLDGLSAFEVEGPTADDWTQLAALVRKYGDFPLGGTDASVAVLADRLGTDLIVTLDRRHFGALRSSSGHAYRLLPE
ncbi:MAG: PIN domain-containing protein [Candidatus Limnocylindrales bacterium]